MAARRSSLTVLALASLNCGRSTPDSYRPFRVSAFAFGMCRLSSLTSRVYRPSVPRETIRLVADYPCTKGRQGVDTIQVTFSLFELIPVAADCI